MGLSAPKNRSRIANDPQNTTWAHNTTRFGHKLLTQQGWTPGSSLGAKDAAHASHYTVASTSHIRVHLKDDTLGLGAKRGSEQAENFGLAGLESVLGRLNGKREEVEKKQEERKEKVRMAEVGRRWGGMVFVSGGFLVGERIEKRRDLVVEAEREREEKVRELEEKAKGKRKRSGDEVEVEAEREDEEQPKLKRKKKSMDLKRDALSQSEESGSSKSKSKSKKDKKEKKSRKSKKSSSPSSSSSESESPSKSEKKRLKAEKRRLKDEKKLRKALKKAAKESISTTSTTPTSSIPTSTPTTGTSTPTAGLTFGAGGRHAVRARFIRQKKMASMDPQALKEIFMIKTPS